MDYLRFQMTSGAFKKTNQSNISPELFNLNAAIFAFDLRTGDYPIAEEVSCQKDRYFL